MVFETPPDPEQPEEKIDLVEYSNQRNYQANKFEALSTLLENSDYTIKKPEDKINRFSRIIREAIILIGVLVGVGFILYFCLYILQSSSSSADDKKWAQSTLTFIVGGGVGYLTGKNKKD